MNQNTHTHADSKGNVTTHTHTDSQGNAVTHTHAESEAHAHAGSGNVVTHTHVDSNGNIITHTHTVHGDGNTGHGHYHSPEVRKKQLNRLSRAAGHLQHVKTMIENDEDCADVLIQLSAVEAALHSLGKEIINEHITHCIAHAIEDGDTEAVEAFQTAIRKFL